MNTSTTYTAFAGPRRIANGDLESVLLQTKARLDRGERATVLIFEDQTGDEVDFDFRGTPEDVVARASPRPGPGRPRLGVVAREVTLLPRHWDWLEQQPSGSSAALRKLVDEARKRGGSSETRRLGQQAASRFMSAMAGNLPGFEEAARALFAGDRKRFRRLIGEWPADIRRYLLQVAAEAFASA